MTLRGWLTLTMACVAAAPGGAQTADELFAEASRFYAEFTWDRAISLFDQFATQFPGDARAPEAEFKALDGRFRLNQFDEYETKLTAFCEKHRRTVWGARGRLLLARFTRDHYGWREMSKAGALFAEALREYRSAIGRRPLEGDELRTYVEMLFEVAEFYGQWWDDRNRSRDLAIEHLETILRYNLDAETNGRALLRIGQVRLNRFQDRAGAEAAFLRVVREFGASSSADDALFALASMDEQAGDFVRARSRYLELRRRYPQSELEQAAADQVRNIEEPQLNLVLSPSHLPGARVPTRIQARNLRGVQFAAWRLDLGRLLTADRAAMNDIDKVKATGRKVFTWRATVDDKGDYQWVGQKLDSPMREAGVYLVEATADGKPGLVRHAMVNVSSLVLVQEYAGRKLVSYVASRATRQPVAQSKVRVWSSRGNDAVRAVAEGTTDADGLHRCEVPRADDGGGFHLISVAEAGDEVAYIDRGIWTWWNEPTKQLNSYVYTDRPVYRPENTVHYRAILRTELEGEYQNLPSEQVAVTIWDARGEKVLEQNLTSDAYGTVAGELTLGAEPALGVYRIQLQAIGQETGGQFRVEEYRKPEYEVIVGQPLADVRPGGAAAVPVDAKYYFGAPVADAEVKYVVQRRPHYPYYWFPRPYDWFFASWRSDWMPRWGHQEVVAEGSTKTDSEGRAVVEFTTANDGGDYVYSVYAEVADVTRRVVDATGSVTVTQKGYYLFADTNQGLYRPDDDVTLTVKAETADHQPVATTVTAELWRMKWIEEVRDEKTNEVKTPARWERDARIFAGRRLETDPNSGQETLIVKAPADGYYQFRLTAQDTFDPRAEVTASADMWTAADAWKGRNYNHANLQLVPERDLYEKGDTARVLVNSPVPNGALLLTIGAEQIYEVRVVRFEQNSFTIDLPIADAYAPNLFLHATLIAAKQAYFADAMLMVPPTDKFVTVTVESDQAEYRPRTKGTFRIKTVDASGEPIAAQVSLGIADESVYAIQDELVPDVGVHYYGRQRGNAIRRALSWEWWGESDDEYNDKVEGGVALRRGSTDGMTAGGAGFAGPAMGGMPGRPMAPPAAAPMAAEAAMDATPSGPGGAAGGAEPVIREFFPDTILWQPTVVTDATGVATVEVEFPDSLTTWRATARAITPDTQAGQRVERVVTSKDLLVRLQAPRFFCQLDRATISLVVTNRTSQRQQVATNIAIEGLQLVGNPQDSVVLEPNGQARVDREVIATTPGRATITVTARGPNDSDGLKMSYEVLPHGADKFQAAAGQVGSSGTAAFTLNLPADRREDATKLTVNVAPSLGTALLDALPYLIEYPYGCVEQTTSRFIPCVLVARVLGYTGTPKAARPAQAPDWWTARELGDLPAMVREGINRLAGMQNPDGGYGWFGGMRSDLWMTAYVVNGLLQARQADYAVPDGMIDGALKHLADNLHITRNYHDNTAYLLCVLSEARRLGAFQPAGEQIRAMEDAYQRVYAQREQLNDYTRALMIVALLNQGETDKAQVLWRNLQARRIETESGVHWGQDRWGWRWSEDQVETTSYALLAAMRAEPESPLVGKAVAWLVMNRSGNRWYSTKDTATALFALATYMDEHDELQAKYTATLLVNGREVKGWEVTPDNALSFRGEVTVDPALLVTGENRIELKREGTGALYYGAMLEYYTKEDPITGAGSYMKADRKYFRVVAYTDPQDNQRKERLEPIAEGQAIASGEQIEVAITIEAENDFSYVAFSDPKPAGCEPVDQTSGGTWGGTYMYRELRDEKVTFFADQLSQGKTEIRYRLRAESPGTFRALPHSGFAMYRADVRCLSDEAIVSVGERPSAEE